jgi:SHS2 domain-containing protein
MPSLARDIQSAREAAERVLDELRLGKFVFTVEAKEPQWLLRVECAAGEDWQEVTLPVDAGELRASLADPAVRGRLRAAWEPHLRACSRRVGGSAGSWEHYPHGADVGVRGRGASQPEAFEQAALALTAVVADPAGVAQRERVAIECEAPDDELLFVDWLNGLVYEMSTRRMLFSRFAVRREGERLIGEAWGEKVEPARHHPAVEVKGATYTTLRVAREGAGWVAQTVVDV